MDWLHLLSQEILISAVTTMQQQHLLLQAAQVDILGGPMLMERDY